MPCETPSPVKSHTRECKEESQDAGESTNSEVSREAVVDPNTRPLDPSSKSTDSDPKRLKPTTETDVEKTADQMVEDTSLRTPATSHPLEPDAARRRHGWQETYSTFEMKTS